MLTEFVQTEGIEPSRDFSHEHLELVRLPITPCLHIQDSKINAQGRPATSKRFILACLGLNPTTGLGRASGVEPELQPLFPYFYD